MAGRVDQENDADRRGDREYSGAKKEIRPVTIATYQVMTTRRGGVLSHTSSCSTPETGA